MAVYELRESWPETASNASESVAASDKEGETI
jgi:hypothetical protein